MLFVALSVIWGLPYLLIRIAVRDISPPTLVFFRTAVAGAAFVPFMANRATFRALLARWRPLLLYTIVEVSAPWFLLSRAEQRLTSSLSGLLVATVPLIAVLISLATRHERSLGWARAAGLVVGFAGVAVIVGIDVQSPNLGAVFEVLGVAVCYATGPFIVDWHLREVSSTAVVGASLVLTGVGYAPFALGHLPVRVTTEELISVLLLIVACTGVAFLVYFALIAEVGPARATLITYVNPAVAVVLGISIVHEHLSAGLAWGIPLVLIGSFLGTTGSRSLSALEPGSTASAEQPTETGQSLRDAGT